MIHTASRGHWIHINYTASNMRLLPIDEPRLCKNVRALNKPAAISG